MPRTASPADVGSDPIDRFLENRNEVERLFELHSVIGGSGPGRRTNIEVLNKSAIVFLTACWESFVEDMAVAAFDMLLDGATEHIVFPMSVLAEASRTLKEDEDDRAVWELAGDGWKNVLLAHRDETCDRYLRKLHIPRAEQVDLLYRKLIGIGSLSNHWHWPRTPSEQAIKQLDELITLRGEIVHRVAATTAVRKNHVQGASRLITHLVVTSHEAVARHLGERLGKREWASYSYRAG